MDLLRPSILKELCTRTGIRPDRKSGQNFLVNRATLERIVAAVDPQPSDTILEVGAGFGVLTLALAERTVAGVPPLGIRGGEGELRAVRNPSQPPLTLRGGDAGRIIAVERDRRITPILRELVMPYGNVEVWERDVLALWRETEERRTQERRTTDRSDRSPFLSSSVLRSNWKLAANLPYSITSDFLRFLFDAVGTGALPPPARAVLLLQREVVDRMCADPSRRSEHRNVGLLTILTQLHCSPRRIARVPAAHFWPAPKVESAVVALENWRTPEEIETLLGGGRPPPRTSSSLAPQHRVFSRSTPDVFPLGKGRNVRDDFLRLVRSCFAHRRRQLHHLLKSHASRLTPHDSCIRLVGIDPTARPETLTLAQWVALVRAVYK